MTLLSVSLAARRCCMRSFSSDVVIMCLLARAAAPALLRVSCTCLCCLLSAVDTDVIIYLATSDDLVRHSDSTVRSVRPLVNNASERLAWVFTDAQSSIAASVEVCERRGVPRDDGRMCLWLRASVVVRVLCMLCCVVCCVVLCVLVVWCRFLCCWCVVG